MSFVERIGFWRRLGRFLNIPWISRMQDPIRPIVERISGASVRRLETEIPFTPLRKPLAECVVTVVSTAGLYPRGAAPFDIDAAKGDASFRVIPGDIDLHDVAIAHAHFSHERFHADPNVLLPLDRLCELVSLGVIAAVAPRLYGFGFGAGLTREYIDPDRGTAHAIARMMKKDAVDLALLVPA